MGDKHSPQSVSPVRRQPEFRARPKLNDAVQQHEQQQALRRSRAKRLGVEMLEVGDLADLVAKLEEDARNGGGGSGGGMGPVEKLICLRAGLRKLLKAKWGHGEDFVLTSDSDRE